MRPHILIAILLFLPLSTQTNIAYMDSSGVIQTGAWFYYNVSVNFGEAIRYINCSVIDMNETHITYRMLWYNETLHTTLNTTITRNVSEWGLTLFYINTSIYISHMKRQNGTILMLPDENVTLYYYVYETNSTYIHTAEVHIENATNTTWVCHWHFWFDTNHIVRRICYYTYINQTKRVGRGLEEAGEYLLYKLWSPKLNTTQGEEFWGWLFRIDPRYIVFGIIIVVLIVGYWWFSREVQKSVGTEAELK